MATYVLVHGAWHGAWCWERIVPILEAHGHRVVAVDLPGHGNNPYPVREITQKTYTDYLTKVLREIEEPVILVGHSQGGAVITQTAEYVPERIKKLVYIAALLMPNGKINADFITADYGPIFENSEDMTHCTLNEGAIDYLYGNCSEEDAENAFARLCVQSHLIHQPMETTEEKFGSVRRVYIETLLDKTLPVGDQRKMQAVLPCEKVFTLNTDHSPFYSKTKELADILLAQALD